MNKKQDSDSQKRIGPYLIKRVLGKGGMGVVYLAEDPETKTEVAIKVLLPHVAEDTNLLNRFAREIDVLRKFHHPNIIQILAMGQDGETCYYVMEYVRGKDIGVMIDEHGSIPWPVALDYGMQICRGLRNAHDHGVVHRDLKPVNFLVDEENTIKIADFGIARPWDDGGHTQTGSLLGTLAYMSPEQAEGKPVSTASDIYSLGASLYVMLTGCPPFASPSIPGMLKLIVNEPFVPPRVKNPSMPVEFDELICALMAKDPSHRPGSAYNVECRLKDVTEIGRGRLFRKKDDQPDSNRDKEAVEHGPTDDLPAVPDHTAPDILQTRNQPRGSESGAIRKNLDAPFPGAQPLGPAGAISASPEKNESRTERNANSQDDGSSDETDFELRPVLDSNPHVDKSGSAATVASRGDAGVLPDPFHPGIAVSNSSNVSFNVPVEQDKPGDWTGSQKLFDTKTVILLIALVVVSGLGIWSSTWPAKEPHSSDIEVAKGDADASFSSTGDLESEPGDDSDPNDGPDSGLRPNLTPIATVDGSGDSNSAADPNSKFFVAAEYGNEFNDVLKFFLINHTSKSISSVNMSVKYVDENGSVLARASVQTSKRNAVDDQKLMLLGPNQAGVIVEPQPLHSDADGTEGIGVPPETSDVVITILQVTFMDESTWSPSDQFDGQGTNE